MGGRLRRAHAAGMDVRDQVAVRVGVAGLRPVGHVRREAVGGRQAGAFSDQEDGHSGGEHLADVVEDSDAAVSGDKGLAASPAASLRAFREGRQQVRDLTDDRGDGKSVTDGDLEIGLAWAAGE